MGEACGPGACQLARSLTDRQAEAELVVLLQMVDLHNNGGAQSSRTSTNEKRTGGELGVSYLRRQDEIYTHVQPLLQERRHAAIGVDLPPQPALPTNIFPINHRSTDSYYYPHIDLTRPSSPVSENLPVWGCTHARIFSINYLSEATCYYKWKLPAEGCSRIRKWRSRPWTCGCT